MNCRRSARDHVKDRSRFRKLHRQGMGVHTKANPTRWVPNASNWDERLRATCVFENGNFLRWAFQRHLIRWIPVSNAFGVVSSNGSRVVFQIWMRNESSHGGQFISLTLQGTILPRRLPPRVSNNGLLRLSSITVSSPTSKISRLQSNLTVATASIRWWQDNYRTLRDGDPCYDSH